ncbi:hypothetical protein D9758_000160 [Tetrapyrgos nigripes]|uniref:DNA recombination and repair protein Rad51-like C-terminal domain-containing protein n=1 Tax=Tetrapyrgos nigripes TaxID=182062 RepID=A0A8H5H185_9AGAR|nr:hypothetical protein D9758_000160 [Tetrapyrgos nigripes]
MASNWLSVPSESLQTLLASVRSQKHASRCRFLDKITLGDVIEVQGPPASGKTHFVYHFLATCIIPVAHHSTSLCGWGKAAVVYDLDHSFDVFRFKKLLLSRLKRFVDVETAQAISNHCIQNLHVFHPHSTMDLAVNVLHLPYYHCSDLSDVEIGLVAVDPISTFYWSDRFSRENIRSSAAPFVNPMQHVMTALEKFRITHGASIVLTTWSLSSQKPPESLLGAPPLQQSSFIAAAIAGMVSLTHLVKLSAPSVPTFDANCTFDALDDLGESSDRESSGILYTADDAEPLPLTLSIGAETLRVRLST